MPREESAQPPSPSTGEASGTRESRPSPLATRHSNPQSLIPNPSSPAPRLPSPAPFRLLLDPPAAGAWNMAVDETLLESAANEGTCTLRFYQWAEPTLSLGYFQRAADRRLHVASINCAMVRRQSGGGAILHHLELTYSLAVPERHPLAKNRLDTYRVVHEALIQTLAQWGIEAKLFQPTGATAGLSSSADGTAGQANRGTQPFLCFERRAPGDVVLGATKIAGSAQRRWRGAVLQHGSVLLARSPAAPELAGIEELSGVALSAEELTEAWLKTLSCSLAIIGERGEISAGERARATQRAAEKYAATAWTDAR
jgi:lipoyl(octanoyl) transferase